MSGIQKLREPSNREIQKLYYVMLRKREREDSNFKLATAAYVVILFGDCLDGFPEYIVVSMGIGCFVENNIRRCFLFVKVEGR